MPFRSLLAPQHAIARQHFAGHFLDVFSYITTLFLNELQPCPAVSRASEGISDKKCPEEAPMDIKGQHADLVYGANDEFQEGTFGFH
jgi:hypothetical protein